jgi:hypothetical protein
MHSETANQATATSTLMVSGIMFGAATLVTLVFGYALVADQSRLIDAWEFMRALPLVVQIVLWPVLAPWMAALWVWTLPLALTLRVLFVVAILAAAEYLLFPWKG